MGFQKNKSRTFSCEFFPPKTDQGKTGLGTTINELGRLQPAYFSCTYGAGGSTQEGTYDTVKAILEKGFVAAPHITCIGSTPEKIKALLDAYIALGIKRIVALRGDLPPGQDKAGHFHYADQLVTFIRQETGKHFHIEIAAYPEKHPEAASIQQDLLHFRMKASAGANAGITQYFYNPDAYFRFMEDCAKQAISIPIVPGIMPITNYKQLARFSESCGAEIPRWIAARLEGYGEDLESIRAFGLDVTRRLCETLLQGGAPGLHFYTLNRTEPTRTLWQQLGL